MRINITLDSRKVKPGDTFVAIKGYTVDGHDYIDTAIANGASRIVCTHGSYDVETIITDDPKAYLIKYLKDNYGDIVNKLKIIGITGTNGKTTSAYLLHSALNKLGKKTAYIGTIGFYIDKKIKSLVNTSPEITDLYELFIEAYENGCSYLVMEVSSQGIMERRMDGIKFDYAVFTNLTQDHLDYHKTMEAYALAKKKLFERLKENGICIINNDDNYSNYYLLENNKNITYGLNSADVMAKNIKMTSVNSSFDLSIFNLECKIKTSLIGDYNIYNLLVVITVLYEEKFKIEEISKVVQNLDTPPGRMDTVVAGDNNIIIDYAHTPDALFKIISTIKKLNPNHLYVVFGCTGDRDRSKRSIMTKIVLSNVNKAIITIDDPHNEDITRIVEDMLENNTYENYEVEYDRRKAIKKGISLMNENDILLVLGKGHEDFIIMKDKKIPFNDKLVVLECLNELEALTKM